jgi:two-component system phosphate regulon sensor histidine kinase PhoR
MKNRIFLWFLLGVTLISMFSAFFIINALRKNHEDEKRKTLLESAYIFEGILNITETKDYDEIFSDLNNFEIRLTLIDKSGTVLYDSNKDYTIMETHKDREEIKSALNGNIGTSSRFSLTLRKQMIYIAIPYSNINHNISVIRTAYPLESIYYFFGSSIKYALLILFFGAVVFYILAIKIANLISISIINVSNSMKRITKGFYGDKIYYHYNDEISELCDSYNNLNEYVNTRITQLTNTVNNLDSVLSSILSSVIVLDKKKRIVYYNSSSERFLGTKALNALNRPFIELVRDYELNKFIDNFFKEKSPNFTELTFGDNIYRFTFNFIEGVFNEYKEGIVVVIQDVTEIRKLEKMRKDFVANVTHELKTPLTSIKGYVEVLKDKEDIDIKTRIRFLDIVEIETERLTDLINEILYLSDVENNKGNVEEFNVNNTISEVIDIMNAIASTKNIQIVFLKKENILLKGDRNRFKQMIINLVDNGIKYGNNGGKIEIITEKDIYNAIIIIKDNGIGIEKKHLDRLFERFYRTDKSRSRNEGGTGLGLAIVKHIVNNYSGKIYVDSEVDVGTIFKIVLPLNQD